MKKCWGAGWLCETAANRAGKAMEFFFFFLLKCKIFVILDQSELMENDLHYNVWTFKKKAAALECGRGASRLHIKPSFFDVNCPDQLGPRTCVNHDAFMDGFRFTLCAATTHRLIPQIHSELNHIFQLAFLKYEIIFFSCTSWISSNSSICLNVHFWNLLMILKTSSKSNWRGLSFSECKWTALDLLRCAWAPWAAAWLRCGRSPGEARGHWSLAIPLPSVVLIRGQAVD